MRKRIRKSRFSTTASVLERRLVLSPVATANDSFESGLPAHWTIPDVSGEGRVSVRNLVSEGLIEVPLSEQFTTTGNQHALVFDSSRASGDTVDDLSVAIMNVDLSSAVSALLTFHQLEGLRGDINDDLPTSHSLTTAGDGLAISNDGITWYTLQNVQGGNINRGGDGLWQLFEYDLLANINRLNTDESAGLSTASPLQIKFSQYDDDVFPRRGWAIDNLQLRDTAGTFDINAPKGVFHRFDLAGEDDRDYYYRAAVFGNVDATTPILVSTHGSNGDANYTGYSRNWHRFVADPVNGVDSLIVVSPAFVESIGPGRFNTPVRYTALSWNTTDDAAADLALLQTVDTITATGIGDGDELMLWGFSAGGQFTGRFTAAHPDRVAAAVVGGPASQILPDESISFTYGLGDDPDLPAPQGVEFIREEFLKSRIMYWVGQDDNDPNHSQLSRGPSVDSTQGITRLQRSVRQFREMHAVAHEDGFSEADFEYELLISEGNGHSWGFDDLPGIYEFMTRQHTVNTPVRIHGKIVTTPSDYGQQEWLPQHISRIAAGEAFHLELWVESASGDAVQQGTVDLYFDATVASATSLSHGHFSQTTSGTIDNSAGRIRSFGGTASTSTAAVDGFALLGRVTFTATSSLASPAEFFAALQRTDGTQFRLTNGQHRRTDLQPIAQTFVRPSGSGDGQLQGFVFDDINADGMRQPNEPGIANRTVRISVNPEGPVALSEFSVEPDDSLGHGAYLNEFSGVVRLSAFGSEIANPGLRASNKGSNESSTGSHVFASNQTNGSLQSQFVEGRRQLRMDFSLPTRSVSIDVIAKLNDASDLGTLDVFDANDQLLDSITSSSLANAASETLTISRAASDIAYAVAYGEGNQNVRLDNLRFTSELVATTDSNGHYLLKEFPAGTFYVASVTLADESQTAGVSPTTELSIQDTAAVTANIGLHRNTISISPSWTDFGLAEGSSRQFSIQLSAAPSSTVTYDLRSDNASQVAISPPTLTFDNSNWNTPQAVTVTAVDNASTDGTTTTNVSVLQGGTSLQSVAVTVWDDESATIDADNNTTADAATDGILIIRYLFGFRGDALISRAVGTGATNTTATEIEAALDNSLATLDTDGNGIHDAATDGILIIRYLFGFRDVPLVAGAVGSGATRSSGPEIAAFLDGFRPPPTDVLVSNHMTVPMEVDGQADQIEERSSVAMEVVTRSATVERFESVLTSPSSNLELKRREDSESLFKPTVLTPRAAMANVEADVSAFDSVFADDVSWRAILK